MEWLEIWKLLSQNRIQKDLGHRIRGIEHEAGKITSCYWLIYSKTIDNENIYFNEMKKELGDLIAMIRMLCFCLNWNYEEIEDNGKKELLDFIITRMNQ